ncbi:hypothetical protein Zm00014a_013499 [Zea mays]|uniref:Uncharacterized protein n=1 Tax=Zea mays TaxID=4577 RepID=A0A317YG86_MAIZE|nr:hypothetical protein Zm00014a_013499 [Zea mays]
MASTSTAAATMVRAAVVAVLLMQCCDVILGARPLLHAAAGWQHGQDAGTTTVMRVLEKGSTGPGNGNCEWTKPGHPGCPPQPSS